MRRSLLVAAPLVWGVLSSTAAFAAWTTTGAGSGTGKATALAAPTASSATTVAPTSSAVDISFTPAANPVGTTYTITRDKTKAGAAGAQVACSGLTASPCHDTGLAGSTTFTYTITAVLGSAWAKASATTPSATTTATFAITSNALSGNKSTFSGVGSSGSTTITVVVCGVNVFPCTSPAATVSKTSPAAGAWGPTAQTGTLSNNTTYYAQATQGSTTSAVYTFST